MRDCNSEWVKGYMLNLGNCNALIYGRIMGSIILWDLRIAEGLRVEKVGSGRGF